MCFFFLRINQNKSILKDALTIWITTICMQYAIVVNNIERMETTGLVGSFTTNETVATPAPVQQTSTGLSDGNGLTRQCKMFIWHYERQRYRY